MTKTKWYVIQKTKTKPEFAVRFANTVVIDCHSHINFMQEFASHYFLHHFFFFLIKIDGRIVISTLHVSSE